MNFIFKIFGVPKVFDLYQGTETEINYFLKFYNGSKENAKLIIHRMASGKVSYSYLRYNFISGSGRTGSFFGMSVVFSDEYCSDIKNLYNLFETVYYKILQDQVLFTTVSGDPLIQAKYLITNFTDAENEVRTIENIIFKNINNQFTADIQPLNASFKTGNPNLKKLNINQGNMAFMSALRQYSWVAISPDYKTNEADTLSDDEIRNLKINIKKSREKSTEISNALLKNDLVENEKIEELNRNIFHCSKNISKYLQYQPELKELQVELNSIKEQYDAIKTAMDSKVSEELNKLYNVSDLPVIENESIITNNLKNLSPSEKQVKKYIVSIEETHGGRVECCSGFYSVEEIVEATAIANKGFYFVNWDDNNKKIQSKEIYKFKMRPENITLRANFKKVDNNPFRLLIDIIKTIFVFKNKKKNILINFISSIIVCMFLLSVTWKLGLFNNEKNESLNCPECAEWLDKAQDYLNNKQFKEAIKEYEKVQEKGIQITEAIEKTKKEAKEYGVKLSKDKFNKTKEGLIESINELNNWKEFIAQKEIEEIQNNFKNQTIEQYKKMMSKENLIVNKYMKYAKIILEFDENDKEAKKVQEDYLSSHQQPKQSQSTSPVVIKIFQCDIKKKTVKEQKGEEITDATFRKNDFIIIEALQDGKLVTEKDNKGNIWSYESITENIIEVNELKNNPMRVQFKKAGNVTFKCKNINKSINVTI